MSPEKKQQTMKPATAAKKLGVYLPATPEEFQTGSVTRQALDRNELRHNEPHPAAALDQPAKGIVSHPRHRRKDQRGIYFDVPDLKRFHLT